MTAIGDAVAGRTNAEGVRAALVGPARARVRGALVRRLAVPGALGRCHLTRVKLKPGRKLDACYSAPLAGAAAAVAVSWTPAGSPSPDAAPFREAQAEAERRGVAGPFSALWALVGDHGVLQIAPMDPAFPQLVRLSDAEHVGELLGDPLLGLRVVRYRPGQRHVLRYDTGAGTTFAKLYRPGRIPPFEAATAAADAVTARGRGLAAGAPGRFVEHDRVLLSDHVDGTPLSARLRAPPGPATGVVLQRAGALLRALHEAPPGNVPVVGAAADASATLRACEHVRHYLLEVGARIEALAARAQEALGPPVELAFSHGDFKADHLLADGDRLAVIDFDSCSRAEPARDLGKMLADLRWWCPAGVESAQKEFLAGYGSGPPPERVRAYEALWLVKMAARRLSMVRRDWAAATAALVDQAAALLDM